MRTQWQAARTARINVVRALLRAQGVPIPESTARVPPHATAFALRMEPFNLVILTLWEGGDHERRFYTSLSLKKAGNPSRVSENGRGLRLERGSP